MTKPIFIVGSGRCGTALPWNLLADKRPKSNMDAAFNHQYQLELNHEYMVLITQKLTCMYRMGMISEKEVEEVLQSTYGSAIHYSSQRVWCDASNKLCWVIDILLRLFPEAHFVSLVRDGRKVVSSYANKLAYEIYDDTSTKVLYDWAYKQGVIPPPEKKYWWPVPKDESFVTEYNQFQRICYHWRESNKAIMEAFFGQRRSHWHIFKLEDLVASRNEFDRFMKLFGIDGQEYWDKLRPCNVLIPQNFSLTDIQQQQFAEICSEMMKVLGYDMSKPPKEIAYAAV